MNPKIIFDHGPGIEPVNDVLPHQFVPQIGPELGGFRFCTDHDGKVTITLRPAKSLTVKPEYVLVASSSPESHDHREARWAQERVEAKLQHAELVAESNERAAERVSRRVAKLCRTCRSRHAECKVKNRSDDECDRGYRDCLADGVEVQPGEPSANVDCSQVP